MRHFVYCFCLWFFAFNSIIQGQEKVKNITPREAFLLKYNSIFKDIKSNENWNDYAQRKMNESAKIPGTLGPNSLGKNALELLFTVDYKKIDKLNDYNDIAIGYLITYHPKEFKIADKVFSDLSQFDQLQALNSMNEFERRRLQEQGKKKIIEDAKKVSLPKKIEIHGTGALLPYDFDKRSFTLDYAEMLFQNFNLYETNFPEVIPLPFREDYKNFPERFELPMDIDEAEKFKSDFDQQFVNKSRNNLLDKGSIRHILYLTIEDKLREQPVYLNTGNSVFAVYNTWNYSIDSLKFYYYRGNDKIKKLLTVNDLPQPKNKIANNLSKSRKTTAPNTSEPSDFPFIRTYANGIKEFFITYEGKAISEPNSLHEIGDVQLRVNYRTYSNWDNHSLGPIFRSEGYMGNIYFNLLDKKKKVAWETIYYHKYDIFEDKKGYRMQIGGKDAKNMTKYGYNNSYFEITYKDHHGIALKFFDENDKLQFTSYMRATEKTEKPPFTDY